MDLKLQKQNKKYVVDFLLLKHWWTPRLAPPQLCRHHRHIGHFFFVTGSIEKLVVSRTPWSPKFTDICIYRKSLQQNRWTEANSRTENDRAMWCTLQNDSVCRVMLISRHDDKTKINTKYNVSIGQIDANFRYVSKFEKVKSHVRCNMHISQCHMVVPYNIERYRMA